VHTAGLAPVSHAGVPFCVVQTSPQPPQLPTLFSGVSHPFTGFASQLPYPVLHDRMQLPPEHDAVSLLVEQTLPHDPQLLGSVPVLVSQLLPGWPEQCAKPGLQDAAMHAPPLHPAVPFTVVQTLPQLPQSLGSPDVSSSQPSTALMLQSLQPGAQLKTLQTPALHVSVAWFWLHAALHALQLPGSV